MSRAKPNFKTRGFKVPQERSEVLQELPNIALPLIKFWHKVESENLQDKAHQLLNSLAWFATEIDKKPAFKLAGQRYLSRRVKENFDKFHKDQQAGQSLGGWEKGLRHDHVVGRKEIIQKLKDSRGDGKKIKRIFRQAKACVVTEAEHNKLNNFKNDSGWARYKKAGVRVWDRQKAQWIRL